MATIAVLGGTGQVGKTIVDVIRENPRYSALVVTRKTQLPANDGVNYVSNDFSNVTNLVDLFEHNNVSIVISCLLVLDESTYKAQQLAIEAAETSASTTSFIASNWANPSDGWPWAVNQHRTREYLATTSLKWTEVATGYFMDFWGIPFLRTNMRNMLPVIDIKHKVAAIPGTGDEVVPFAYSFDVARFVINVLIDLPAEQWEPITTIVGDRVTWHQFLALAEDVRGSKFDVTYDSFKDLAAGSMTELPNHKEAYAFFPKEELRALYSGLELAMAAGDFDIPPEKFFNRKYSEFRMMTVAKMLEETWKANGRL